MAAEPPAKLDYKSRRLVGQIVEHVKSQGIFDQFRRECIEELEQKESYRQLTQRVESHVATFLSKQTWSDALPKNQVRDSLRKHINQSEVLDRGVKQLISQALESKSKVFQTRIEGVVQNYIYTQKHPQNHDKQNRKRKAGDDKEVNKPSVPEVICDISQLIPVPTAAGSKNEGPGTEKGKSGLQEGFKGVAAAKGIQPVKKSLLTQGKASSLAAKGEETKPGSPSCRKEQTEENSRTKEGKNKMSRVKVESMSRDGHSQTLVKSEESAHRLKDDKIKVSRFKMENCNTSDTVSSSLPSDISSSNSQDGKTNTLTGFPNLSPSRPFPVDEDTGSFQVDVTRLLQVKSEKAKGSESYVSSPSDKLQVKAEGGGTSGIEIEVESTERAILHDQTEKIVDDDENERVVQAMDGKISKPVAGIQRIDYFAATSFSEGIKDEIFDEEKSVNLDEKRVSTSEEDDKWEEAELGENLETTSSNALRDIKDLETESDNRKRIALASDVCKVGTVELPASGGVVEPEEKLLRSDRAGVAEMSRVNEKSQGLSFSHERGLLSWEKDNTVKSEPISNKAEPEAIERENTGHASSNGENSDVESDISEVSSVHTSDLSSLDDDISSSSESSYAEPDGEAGETAKSNEKPEKDEGQEKSSVQPQNEQGSDVAPMRRSTRISSRRSTKEGESEVSGSEGNKIQAESRRQRRRGEKRDRKVYSKTGRERSDYPTEKRKRGRPRKEEARASSHSSNQRRRSRKLDPEDSSTAEGRSGSGEDRSKRSQRQIKRTRCYSPSSEGTREVFLPRKRSRDHHNS